ncbi:MAG: class I SAM-dependent methyltransferase [Candidatus Hermodarchaeia archaeon]|jgi:ubiquinone/menaquinone biosynthesis C-methylase UbiE
MPVFEDLAFIYDQAIDWEQRLAREIPFLTKFVQDKPNARILDLACGSGRHAVALASQGYEVTGLDLSPQMVKAAKHRAKEKGVSVQFSIADMRHLRELLENPFDLVICLGNSLALLPALSDVQQTITNVHQLLTQGGSFVSQILNFEEIRLTGFRFFPLKSGRTKNGEEVVFARFFEPQKTDESRHLVFLGITRTESGWQPKLSSQQVLQLDNQILKSALNKAGFKHLVFYQDYNEQSFNPLQSRNLISIGTKKI